ncbi:MULTISPECIES: AMP-binding protein [unclassified Streptomyces]|uniref:AMP-binding protein n=1 Tax=unclassified Streptomyces TaxID=2593676 RepID=UPI003811A0FA
MTEKPPVESCLAVTRAGAVGVPVDPESSDAELTHHLLDSGARTVITGATQLPQVERTLRGGTLDCGPIVVGATESVPGVDDVEQLAVTPPLTPARDDLGLDETAWALCTSGTTGRLDGPVNSELRQGHRTRRRYRRVPHAGASDRHP